MLEKEEAIYGLGILQNGKMSQRNQRKYLMPGNVEDGITFFQSVKGYGLFWDNYSPTNFADDENETSFESEVGDCTDYSYRTSTHVPFVDVWLLAEQRAL